MTDMKWMLVAVIVLCTVLSDVLQSHEMKRHGEVDAFRVSGLKQTVTALFSRPLLLFSILCLAVSFFAWLSASCHSAVALSFHAGGTVGLPAVAASVLRSAGDGVLNASSEFT